MTRHDDTQDTHARFRHRGEPRYGCLRLPRTSRRAAVAAVTGASAVAGLAVAATTLAGFDTGSGDDQVAAGAASDTSASVHPQGTPSTPASNPPSAAAGTPAATPTRDATDAVTPAPSTPESRAPGSVYASLSVGTSLGSHTSGARTSGPGLLPSALPSTSLPSTPTQSPSPTDPTSWLTKAPDPTHTLPAQAQGDPQG